MMRIGQLAPGFSATTLDGRTRTLEQLLDHGGNVLLVFLRHTG